MANFELWHQEDGARDPDATPDTIVDIKRAIDRLNQQRNDLAEQLDLALLQFLAAHRREQNGAAPLHSEAPGLIIDRLSILSLKLFHTEEQTHRADRAHRNRAAERLRLLQRQRSDLAGCLTDLWHEVLAGTRRFQLYRQLKMYNDPALNPVLYAREPPPTP